MFYHLTKKIAYTFLILILLSSFLLMFNAAQQDSLTFDEANNIASGYSYLTQFDYRLNPAHPPLIKILSALPLLFLHLNFPNNNSAWQNGNLINSEWNIGKTFIYQNNNSDAIILIARIIPIILTLITIFFVFIISKELIGNLWALLPTFLFAFSPLVLGQGHLATNDIGATLGFLLMFYVFTKFLEKQNTKQTIISGIIIGLSLLTKFSTIIFLPLAIILFAIFYWAKKQRNPNISYQKEIFQSIGRLLLLLFIALIEIYIIYFIFTFHSSTTLTIQQIKNFNNQNNIFLNFIANLAANKITLPLSQYLFGVFINFHSLTNGGQTSYFIGQVSNQGWLLYFPLIFILKEPLPSLILILTAIFLLIKNIIKSIKNKNINKKYISEYLGIHFLEFSLCLFIIIYWIISIQSKLDLGLRYLLPTFPAMYILTAYELKNWVAKSFNLSTLLLLSFINKGFNLLKRFIKIIFILFILLWLFIETLVVAPYFISYFNELAGGTSNGYKYAIDSNYDWGQDLKRLAYWINKNNINKIAVDYFGNEDINYYLGDKAVQWNPTKGSPLIDNIHWLAISITNLATNFAQMKNINQSDLNKTYQWLTILKQTPPGINFIPTPDYRIGTSIFVYKLD
ncbi:MAG: glycosyltransferase family 39 protein [Minisyncoccia bacterium]